MWDSRDEEAVAHLFHRSQSHLCLGLLNLVTSTLLPAGWCMTIQGAPVDPRPPYQSRLLSPRNILLGLFPFQFDTSNFLEKWAVRRGSNLHIQAQIGEARFLAERCMLLEVLSGTPRTPTPRPSDRSFNLLPSRIRTSPPMRSFWQICLGQEYASHWRNELSNMYF